MPKPAALATQQAIRALLPAEPNERMRYNCQPVP
jgi:hypothetical protein